MNLPKILSSPLAATAGVIAGMAMLAIPLRQLTSAAPMPPPDVAAAPSTTSVPAWLTLKLLVPAKSVTLKTAAGQVLWDLKETPAGDVETQTDIPLDGGELDVTLGIAFDSPGETAAFLTIAPDGLREETRHAIGSGGIDEPLTFTWPAR